MTERFKTRAQAFEESENIGRNPSDNPTLGDIIAARFARRDILQGALGVAAIAATLGPLALASARKSADQERHAVVQLQGSDGRRRTRRTTWRTGTTPTS